MWVYGRSAMNKTGSWAPSPARVRFVLRSRMCLPSKDKAIVAAKVSLLALSLLDEETAVALSHVTLAVSAKPGCAEVATLT